MIYSLKITDPERITTPWWKKVETLCAVDTFEFSTGANILWGRNASGKSTILRLLAQWFHACQGGRSLVTEDSIHESHKTIDMFKRKYATLDGAEIKHDGKPVIYSNPDTRIGPAGLGGRFDYDFLDEGLASIFARGSSGQMAINRVMKAVKKEVEPGIRFTMAKDRVNDLWKGWIEDIEKMLAPNSPPGPQTMLFDEPDRSLDLDNAATLWEQMPSLAKRCQVIVATHSQFALNIPGARYIELSAGYLEKCRALSSRRQ